MVERRVKVTLEISADGAVKLLNDTGKAAEGAADQFDKLGRSASENEKAIKDAGLALTAFGAGGAAALVATGKAAVDWESAWAGVTKTVDGSTSQLADLEDGLRSMARELPSSHQEIAAVAEAAGQLGVQTESIEGFTKTMIDLGETTNLTADEAATSIAQLMNVMGTAPDQVDNLGSALVALGNDGASTERQIVQMAQGMAGAAAVVGMSEQDVLAVANAFASVGIEVEAGGSSFSRVVTDMAKAAAQGGDELELFAQVAGMSAEQFATAFREDPAQAFATFIGGLSDMQAAGQDVFTVLDDLGMSDVRVSRALLSMATSGDLLTDSLELGSKAWAENTALADEAAKRYETTAAQLEVAKNNVYDAAISFGEVLLPAIVGASDAIAGFAGWLADLPPEAQAAAVGVGAIATASATLLGTALLVVPKVIELHKALKQIQTTAPLAAAGLRGVAAAAAGLSALVILDQLNEATGQWTRRADDVDQLAESLRGLGDAADFAEAEVAWMTRSSLFNTEEVITGAEALDRFAESAQIAFGDTVMDKIGRLQNAGSFDRFIERTAALDQTLAEMVASGNAQQAADLFDLFWSKVKDIDGVELAEIEQGFTQYNAALDANAASTAAAAEAWDNANFPGLNKELTDNELANRAAALAQNENSEAAEELARAYAELLGEMGAGSSSFVSLTGALDATQAKTQEWAQAQADATETTKDSWEDFYDGHSVQLDEYLAELQSMVDAQTNWQSNMSSLVGRVSDETLQELARLGPEGAPLVAALVDASAEELAEFEELFGASGAEAGGQWAAGLEGAQTVAGLAGQKLGSYAMGKLLEELQSGETSAAQAVLDYNLKAELEVLADTDPAAAEVLAQVNAIEATEAVMDVGADVGGAEESHQGFVFAVDESSGTVRILGDTGPGAQSVADFQQDTNSKSATLLIYANTSGIYDAVGSAMYWINSQRPVLRVGMDRLALAGGGAVALADGGPVRGPGGPRDDLVRAYNRDTGAAYALSNGEHVFTAAEVNAAGGHGEIYRLRKALLAGAVRFDVGGGVGSSYAERFGAMRAMPAPQVHVTAPSADFDYGAIAGAVAAAMREAPILVETKVGSRTVFAAASEGRSSYGHRAEVSGAPRITQGGQW